MLIFGLLFILIMVALEKTLQYYLIGMCTVHDLVADGFHGHRGRQFLLQKVDPLLQLLTLLCC